MTENIIGENSFISWVKSARVKTCSQLCNLMLRNADGNSNIWSGWTLAVPAVAQQTLEVQQKKHIQIKARKGMGNVPNVKLFWDMRCTWFSLNYLKHVQIKQEKGVRLERITFGAYEPPWWSYISNTAIGSKWMVDAYWLIHCPSIENPHLTAVMWRVCWHSLVCCYILYYEGDVPRVSAQYDPHSFFILSLQSSR
jgi:hypothetical protein